MAQGYLAIVLHAHLPYIRHPEVEEHGFEWWFYEAAWEVYAPLLAIFERLDRDSVPFRLTVSISPPLLAMFCDRVLNDRLEAGLRHVFEIPENSIDGASKIVFKAYPGVFASVMDGLEGMLRMPGG